MRNKNILVLGIMFLLVAMLVFAAGDPPDPEPGPGDTGVFSYTINGLSKNGWISGTNDTIEFQYKYIGAYATADCTLKLNNGSIYGDAANNSTTANNTLTTIYSNTPLTNRTHNWKIRCVDETSAYNSTTRNVNVDNKKPNSTYDLSNTEWINTISIQINFTLLGESSQTSNANISVCEGTYCNNPLLDGSVQNITLSTEGNHTVKYIGKDEVGNTESIRTMYVAIDNSAPTITTIMPVNDTDYTSQNTFNFTFNVTDAYSQNFTCSLYINNTLNSTKTNLLNGTISNFSNIQFIGGVYDWNINCTDYAGNKGGSGVNIFSVNVVPDKAVLWNLPLLVSTDQLNVIGYVNKSGSNITVYAGQGLSSNSNSSITYEASKIINTIAVANNQVVNSTSFLINKSLYENIISAGQNISFDHHNRSYFLRYGVTSVTNLDANYILVNITPGLEENISSDEPIYIHNNSKPSGWFNITVDLFSGENQISANGEYLSMLGLSSAYQTVFYDNTKPSINLSLVTNYTTNIPNIYYTIRDDYGLNLSSFELIVNDSTADYIYNVSNMTCTGNSEYITCNISLNLSNGYYNITGTAIDLVGNINSSQQRRILVNGQEPTIQLVSPLDNNVEIGTNNISFTFNSTDLFSTTMNCSLYIDGLLNQTNETVFNGSDTIFHIYNILDSTYDWNIQCENNIGGYNTSETYTLTVDNTPNKPMFWPYSDVTTSTNINLVGVIGNNDTLINATVSQGEFVPYYNYTTTTQGTHWFLTNTTLRQDVYEDQNCIYVNKTLNESFVPGYWMEFANHNKTNAYFARYNISNRSNNFEGEENLYYTKVCLQDNLSVDIPQGTSFSVYDTKYPAGWFNMTITLNQGANNITMYGTRIGLTGPTSNQISIYRDNQGPTINTSNIPGNVTTSQPLISFTVIDGYAVNISKLLVEFNPEGIGTNKYHAVQGSPWFNNTGWTFGDNITCSGTSTKYDCSFNADLSDGNYSINISVNDTMNNYAEAIVSELIVKTSVANVSLVEDEGVTTSDDTLFINWSDHSLETYFSHYQVSVGTEQYPIEGYNSVKDWFNVTNNFVNATWNLTPGYAYYFNVRIVDIYDNLGNVTSSNGIIYEDNTQPVLGYINLTGTSDNNAWTNNADTLQAYWNFSDNETGISHYEYAIGNDTYPRFGWNSIKAITQTNYSSLSVGSLTLEENTSYYFSVRARNNYQYEYGWSDWYSSTASIKVDISDPVGGYIDYTYGEYTGNSITITYGTGEDNYSGIDRAALMKATAPMDPNNGGVCGGYESYAEITNVTETGLGLTTTYTYNGLENGKCYRFALYVWDEAGNREEYYLGNQVYNVSVDSTPPTSFTVTDDGHITGSKTLDFSWEASTDLESGINHYDYQLEEEDGTVLVAWTNNDLTTSVLLANLDLVDETVYYLKVRAWNNMGLQTNSSSDGITYLDLSVPAALTLESISNDTNASDGWNDFTNVTTTTINLTGEPGIMCVWSHYDIAFTQPSQATNYSWWCNNSANNTGDYTCVATNITEGVWDLHVTCRDQAGNLQTMNENTDFTFTKEYAAPQITINYPENNSVVNGVIEFNTTIWDVSNYTANYKVRKQSDNSLVDSGAITNPESISIDTSELGGQYTFIVYAIDEYGHSGNKSINVIVNNDVPTVNIELNKNYYSQDFNFTLRSTLYENLTYNITNSSGSLIQNQNWTNSVMQNFSLFDNVSVNLTNLAEGLYTIYSIAVDNDSVTQSDSATFYVDKTVPEYKGTATKYPSTIYENDTVTLYLNWKELYSMDSVWVRHNANGSFVNYTAQATTSGVQIYENATRYKVEIPSYMLTTNETVNYTWYAKDTAGNEASYSLQRIGVTNRAPNITTNNLTNAWEGVVYQELIYFTDADDSQNNASYFNCTVQGQYSLNATIQSKNTCLITWVSPVEGEHPFNITVRDLVDGTILSNDTVELNLTVLQTIQQNNTINSSHTATITYLSGNNEIRSSSFTQNGNMTIPAGVYDLRIKIDNLIVRTSNYNVTNNLDLFFQLLNNDSIDYEGESIGPNKTYRPLEAYAFRVNSTHNGSYIIAFNYSKYDVANPSALVIFKFKYDEDAGEINYSDKQTARTSITSGMAQITVTNFSAFILTYNSDAVQQNNNNNNNNNGRGGNGGGGSGGRGGSFYISPATCTDGLLNQDEVGIDCGGVCGACETCHDGILNQNEIDIDCGGTCAPCHAPTCTDGIMNDGETGIDCGGPCAPCPGCNNNYLDEGEEGLDCGGVCSNECVSESEIITETQVVEKPVKHTPSYVWLILIGISLFGGIAGLWIYNKEEKVIKKTKVQAKLEESEVEDLMQEEKDVMGRYIYQYLSQGLSEDDIKNQLVVDGFKSRHINTVMAAVIRDRKLLEIQDYFNDYMQKGYNQDELKNWVLKQGINQTLVEEALTRRNIGNGK